MPIARLTYLIVAGSLLVSLSACNLPMSSTPTPFETSTQPAAADTSNPTLPPPTTAAPTAFQTVASPALTRIDMIDGLNGWGVSWEYILRTRDSGATWENITPIGSPLTMQPSVFFLDAAYAWVHLPSTDFSSGMLYRTQDGGSTWSELPTAFAGAQIYFLDAYNGWAMEGTGAAAGSMSVNIHRTSDGGATWEAAYIMTPGGDSDPGALPFSGTKNGIAFRDMTHGWVTGAVPMDGFVWLYATQDGAKTWQKQELVLPVGYENAFVYVEPPRFFNVQQDLPPNFGAVLPVSFLLGDTYATAFYVSRDGGVTWTVGQPAVLKGVYAIPTLDSFRVWDGSTLLTSNDGGQSWMSLQPNVQPGESIAWLDYVDGFSGWVSGLQQSGGGELYRTTDGGTVWQEPGSSAPPPTRAATFTFTPSPSATMTSTPEPSRTPTSVPTRSYAGPSKRKGVHIEAVRLDDKPVIDGVLDEWKLDRYAVENVVFGKKNWSGKDDLSGKAMFGWNAQFLFIAVRVWDDVHMQSASGKNLYKGDSVEFQLDIDVPGDFYLEALNRDDFQVGISSGAPPSSGSSDIEAPTEAYLWYPERLAGALGNEVKIGVVYVDDGYKLEAAIPWSVFGISPKAGQHYGFAFSISDNDNTSRSEQQTMVSLVPGRMLTNPTTWGDLELVRP